jgi:hypothetical protein
MPPLPGVVGILLCLSELMANQTSQGMWVPVMLDRPFLTAVYDNQLPLRVLPLIPANHPKMGIWLCGVGECEIIFCLYWPRHTMWFLFVLSGYSYALLFIDASAISAWRSPTHVQGCSAMVCAPFADSLRRSFVRTLRGRVKTGPASTRSCPRALLSVTVKRYSQMVYSRKKLEGLFQKKILFVDNLCARILPRVWDGYNPDPRLRNLPSMLET